jgi:hypothetical protein
VKCTTDDAPSGTQLKMVPCSWRTTTPRVARASLRECTAVADRNRALEPSTHLVCPATGTRAGTSSSTARTRYRESLTARIPPARSLPDAAALRRRQTFSGILLIEAGVEGTRDRCLGRDRLVIAELFSAVLLRTDLACAGPSFSVRLGRRQRPNPAAG